MVCNKKIRVNGVEVLIPIQLYNELRGKSSRLIMKSKGEKHSVSKVKTLNAVDVESIAEIKDFVDSAVTENRLEQGLGCLNEMKIEAVPKNTGEFLRWVVTDILKEETDTIVANQFDMKKVKSAIVNKARVWFLNKL